MVFDRDKNLVATSGDIFGSVTSYPRGILDYTDHHGEDRVTWQLQSGLRFASVAIKYAEGYIVAAQPLYETEKTINTIGDQVLAAWITCIVLTSLGAIAVYLLIRKIDSGKTL